MPAMNLQAIVRTIDTKKATLTAFASTMELDRSNEIMEPAAFTKSLESYRKNPVVLWAHDHYQPPIGKSLAEQVVENGLIFQPQFAESEYPFAKTIWNLYKSEYLNSFSVGFIPKAAEQREIESKQVLVHTEVELLEVSAVPVPSNRGAVALRIFAGTADLKAMTSSQVTEALITIAQNAEEQKKIETELHRIYIDVNAMVTSVSEHIKARL